MPVTVCFKEGYPSLSEYQYDLFVIGAGSGGVRASRIAASLGARVAIAEERYFGGTCVNVGCVPKKLYSYAAHYRDDMEDSRGFGWNPQGVDFNWHTLKSNKDKEIKRLNNIYKSILDNNGVTVYQHRARLVDKHTVAVGEDRITAKYILLAVGGWPWIPDYPGSDMAMNSNDVFELEELPESVVVVGGGYIAVEFASIFSRLGAKTTLVYRGDQLLRGFDQEVRRFITAEIGQNLDLILNCDIREISNNNNRIEVSLNNETKLLVDGLVSATGRKPLTADLGLENTEIQLAANGAIVVNDSFQTAESNIYAVGDVIDRVALTPVALAEGQIVARQLFDSSSKPMNYKNIPTAVFCHPNIATCGLTEEEAEEQDLDVDVYTAKVRQLKHTLSGRNEHSFIKLIVDQSSDKVLGAHLVTPDAGELMQGIAVAMNAGATKADFDNTIGIHPTFAEEVVTLREKRQQAV